MAYSPSVQAGIELHDRFIQAVARREIPAGTPFRTGTERDGDGIRKFCLDSSGVVMPALGSVLFQPNITDPFSGA